MTNVNPYSPPTAFDSQPASREMPSTRRLWIAYGIAPLVAPLVSAVTVFVVGMVYLANHPEDTGTPIGVIAFPVVLLVVGVPASYVVAGLIGMPIAFALRKRNRLNGCTVHGAALLWAALLGAGLAIAGVFIAAGILESIGLDFVGHPDRLKTPLIRKEKGGELAAATWEEAYDFIAGRLTGIKEKSGPYSIAGLSSARCTNEENYLFQKFIRAAIGTNHVDHCARL